MVRDEGTPAVGAVRGFEDLIRAGSADSFEFTGIHTGLQLQHRGGDPKVDGDLGSWVALGDAVSAALAHLTVVDQGGGA